MNQQELQIQLSTQLPNVLCSMISDYAKFKTMSLLKLYQEQEIWRNLLSHLRKFPTDTQIHFTNMDEMDGIELQVQQVYYFNTFKDGSYRETEALVKLENGCYAYLQYTNLLYWGYQKLSAYLCTTIEGTLNLNRDLIEKVWKVQKMNQ